MRWGRRSPSQLKGVDSNFPSKVAEAEGVEMLAIGGVLSMLQQYNFLYNQQSLEFRQKFLERWDVRERCDRP